MYRYVIFDLDGTLLDTLQDLAAAGNHTLSAMGLPTHAVESYRSFVGNGIPKLIERMLPPNHRQAGSLQIAHTLFERYYAAHLQDYTRPYPGILDMLARCRQSGIRMAVASNKGDSFVKTIVNEYFPAMFCAAAGAREDQPKKPAPDMIFALMHTLGANQNDTLYVGDSDVDIQCAQNAQLRSAGVCWGFRGREELLAAGADFLVDTADELCTLILTGSSSLESDG